MYNAQNSFLESEEGPKIDNFLANLIEFLVQSPSMI